MPENAAFLQRPEEKQLFKHEKYRVIKAPEQESPVCAVPNAGQSPDHEDVEKLPAAPAAIPAEGDVHIIAEPGAERHVPAPPEFRHAGGDVWVVEVFLELETYHPPEADGHVGIAGEVKVDLQREGRNA